MAITKSSRWSRLDSKLNEGTIEGAKSSGKGFWDRRPFTRIVYGFRGMVTLNEYIDYNKLEGFGCSPQEARFILKWENLRVFG